MQSHQNYSVDINILASKTIMSKFYSSTISSPVSLVVWLSCDLWRHSRPLCTLEMTVHNVLTRWVGAHLELATDAVAAANRLRQGVFGSQSAATPSWARS